MASLFLSNELPSQRPKGVWGTMEETEVWEKTRCPQVWGEGKRGGGEEGGGAIEEEGREGDDPQQQ